MCDCRAVACFIRNISVGLHQIGHVLLDWTFPQANLHEHNCPNLKALNEIPSTQTRTYDVPKVAEEDYFLRQDWYFLIHLCNCYKVRMHSDILFCFGCRIL